MSVEPYGEAGAVIIDGDDLLDVIDALNFAAEDTAYTDTPEGPRLSALAAEIEETAGIEASS